LRQLPNLLTLIRLVASPVVAWLLLGSRFREALALVLFAGLTDWFDGWAARRLKTTDRLGAILDPLADKTLLVVLFVTLSAVGLIPPWLFLLVIGRDAVIVIGALLLRVFRDIRAFVPSILGKVSTFFQIVLVLLVLLHASFSGRFLLWLENIGLALCVLFTAVSGLDYIRRGIQMATRKTVSEI
jgi:cardiolipin synthase (CMP-forming)